MAPTEVLAVPARRGHPARCSTAFEIDGRRQPVRPAVAHRRAAHEPHHRGRAPAHPRPASRTAPSTSSSAPTPSSRKAVRFASLGAGRHRRAAPLRGRAARRAAQLEPRRDRARRAGDDGHPDPAVGRDDRLRRPRRLDHRRAAAGSDPDPHGVGPVGGGRRRRVAARPRRGRGRSSGVRGVPAGRRVREARGVVGHRDVRAAGGRPAVGPPRRAAPRAHEGRREGSRDGRVPRRSSSTCWSPPR